MSANALAQVAFLTPATELESIADDITIGKDVLELITGAMYADPLSIYREYLQNAADAIDEARAAGLYKAGINPKVSIRIDREQRSVTITDTGIGVPNAEFVHRLTAIGGSRKRGAAYRGFRGVGRLSGLGYCQEVIFRSRSVGDKKVLEIHWDGRRLKEVLRDNAFRGGLPEAIRNVAKKATAPRSSHPPHFFEVELRKVARVKNDLLLNEETVRDYIAQVGPVGFHPEFSFGREIEASLSKHGIGASISIELNDGQGEIYRQHRDEFRVNDKQEDRVNGVEIFEIPGSDGGAAAVGWFVHHSYFGALPRRAGIGGIRARVGNLQIGGSDLFAPCFIEPRFNQWCSGEIHIISNRLIPNGRRDDFEYSTHYENLLAHLSPRLGGLMKICRERSELRQKLKTANLHVQKARHSLLALRARDAGPIARKVAQWQCEDALKDLERAGLGRVLSDAERELIGHEHARLAHDLRKAISRHSDRDPFRLISPRKREDVQEVVRLIFDRIGNRKKAEDLAKRILAAFR
jgi:hypothetical protein